MITENGYKLPLLSDIRRDIAEAIRSKFPELLLEPESVEGHITDVVAERIWRLEQKLQSLFALTPATAKGIGLDHFAVLKTLTRIEAQPATVFVTLVGPDSTLVTQGLKVKDIRGFEYQLSDDVLLDQTCDNLFVIRFSSIPSAGTITVNVNGTATSLSWNQPLTDHPLISDVEGDFVRGFKCTVSETLDSVSVTRSATYNSTPTAQILESDLFFKNTISSVAIEFGAYSSAPYTVNSGVNLPGVIEYVYNSDFSVGGSDRETDEEFYNRFISNTGAIGGSIQGIINNLIFLANEGRIDDLVTQVKVREHYGTGPEGAPNPLEVYVEGGTTIEQKIAEIIRLYLVSAGITLLGDLEFTVVDSEGVAHESRFSRPELVDVYVNIELEVDSSYPGDEEVKKAIFEWGSKLRIGQDVIRIPGLTSSLRDIPGILNVDTLGLSTDGITFEEDNLEISDWSLSNWNIDNINVTII